MVPLPPFPPTKNFIVFFDFNRTNLTAHALTIMHDAVKTAKSGGGGRPTKTSQFKPGKSGM